MSEQKRVVMLGIVLVILLGGILVFSPKESDSYFSFTTDVSPTEIKYYEVKNTGEEIIVDLSKQEKIHIEGENKNSDLILGETEEDSAVILVSGNGESKGAFKIDQGFSKKIDIDSDGVYDFLLSLDSVGVENANLRVSSIDESIGIGSKINEELDRVLGKSEGSSESFIIFYTFLLIFLVVFVYSSFNYFIPYMKVKMIKSKQDNVETMKLISESFQKEIKKKNFEKAKSLYLRLKLFYKYLPDSDKLLSREYLREAERVYKSKSF